MYKQRLIYQLSQPSKHKSLVIQFISNCSIQKNHTSIDAVINMDWEPQRNEIKIFA